MTIYFVFWDYYGDEIELHFVGSTEEKAKEYIKNEGNNSFHSIVPWIIDKDYTEQK